MTHGRKPRKPRRKVMDNMAIALSHASRLTPAEIATIMKPARECFAYMRTATATELQYQVLHSTLVIAQAIEDAGIVRGLVEHIELALTASSNYSARSLASGAWQASACDFHELDAIGTMLDLHTFQLEQLSDGERHRIVQRLIARTKQEGGQVLQVENDLSCAQPYLHQASTKNYAAKVNEK